MILSILGCTWKSVISTPCYVALVMKYEHEAKWDVTLIEKHVFLSPCTDFNSIEILQFCSVLFCSVLFCYLRNVTTVNKWACCFIIVLDINECLRTNDCEQVCFNLDGSHTCGCRKGYMLRKDGRTCQGNKILNFWIFDIYTFWMYGMLTLRAASMTSSFLSI